MAYDIFAKEGDCRVYRESFHTINTAIAAVFEMNDPDRYYIMTNNGDRIEPRNYVDGRGGLVAA